MCLYRRKKPSKPRLLLFRSVRKSKVLWCVLHSEPNQRLLFQFSTPSPSCHIMPLPILLFLSLQFSSPVFKNREQNYWDYRKNSWDVPLGWCTAPELKSHQWTHLKKNLFAWRCWSHCNPKTFFPFGMETSCSILGFFKRSQVPFHRVQHPHLLWSILLASGVAPT